MTRRVDHGTTFGNCQTHRFLNVGVHSHLHGDTGNPGPRVGRCFDHNAIQIFCFDHLAEIIISLGITDIVGLTEQCVHTRLENVTDCRDIDSINLGNGRHIQTGTAWAKSDHTDIDLFVRAKNMG